ncbi:small-subunit processome [Dipodascopsis uninucleata]
MSSLRHQVQKKQHRERAQPQSRKKWGLLEKHKDYVLRARDYHQKKSRLKSLREKATYRNPDEFYHGMLSSRTDSKGVKQKDRITSIVLTQEEAMLLKTQDEAYIVTVINQEKKKIERLEERLAFKTAALCRSKENLVSKVQDELSDYEYDYSDDEEPKSSKLMRFKRETKKKGKNPHILFALDDSTNTGNLEVHPVNDQIDGELTKLDKRLLQELSDRQQRLQQLEKILIEIQLQRQLMKPGSKKKILKSDGSVAWKWKTQRKK